MNEISIREIADCTGGTVSGDGYAGITGVGEIATASASDICFACDKTALGEAERSEAGCVITAVGKGLEGRNCIEVEDPKFAFATVVELFHPPAEAPARLEISRSAEVHPSVSFEGGAEIGSFVSVGEGCTIGRGVRIMVGSVVGSNCRIGADTVLFPRVVVYANSVLGNRVRVHAGAVIGGDGFGYATTATEVKKIRHIGKVVIEDDVEIGANTCVDRATLGATRIGRGSKLDNLVQVGHNVTLGEYVGVAGQAGIAGSTTIGPRSRIEGQAGVSGHLRVGSDVHILGRSAVLFGNLEQGSVVAGVPAVEHVAWKKQLVRLKRLKEVFDRLDSLERKRPTLEA